MDRNDPTLRHMLNLRRVLLNKIGDAKLLVDKEKSHEIRTAVSALTHLDRLMAERKHRRSAQYPILEQIT